MDFRKCCGPSPTALGPLRWSSQYRSDGDATSSLQETSPRRAGRPFPRFLHHEPPLRRLASQNFHSQTQTQRVYTQNGNPKPPRLDLGGRRQPRLWRRTAYHSFTLPVAFAMALEDLKSIAPNEATGRPRESAHTSRLTVSAQLFSFMIRYRLHIGASTPMKLWSCSPPG